jgi:hypothetical protein
MHEAKVGTKLPNIWAGVVIVNMAFEKRRISLLKL